MSAAEITKPCATHTSVEHGVPALRLTTSLSAFLGDAIPRSRWISGRMNGLRAEPGNFRRGGIRDAGNVVYTSLPRVARRTPLSRRRPWPSSDQDCPLLPGVCFSSSRRVQPSRRARPRLPVWCAIRPARCCRASPSKRRSPALIEKVRTAVTDGQGQYKIIDLRPGIYQRDLHARGLQHPAPRRRRADRPPSPPTSTPTCRSARCRRR